MLLADIGNTHFHIYNGSIIEHLTYAAALEKYKEKSLHYICVKQQLSSEIEKIKTWKNISSLVHIESDYDTMGVDRRALCLSHKNGVFVDAGSAITVDVVKAGVYQGGYIYPGLKALLTAYADISPVLNVELNKEISLNVLPSTTKDGISYGIIASIKALIDQQSKGQKLYFTGGDGKFLSTFFETATYDETLVFLGMQKALQE